MRTAAALLALLSSALAAQAANQSCPLPGEKPVLAVRLFFGQDIAGRAPVTAAEWDAFLSKSVTPLFPAGFTVYDAGGQWQGVASLVKEHTKVIEIEAEDSPALRRNLEEIAAAYRARFHQDSVGIVTASACARF